MRQALWLSFQVSEPGSPGAGMVKVRHASLPVSASKAPTQLRVPCEPPVLSPWMTSSLPPADLDGERRAGEGLGLRRRAGLGVHRRRGLDFPGDLAGSRDRARSGAHRRWRGRSCCRTWRARGWCGSARSWDRSATAARPLVPLRTSNFITRDQASVTYMKPSSTSGVDSSLPRKRAAGRASADREHEFELRGS